MKRKKKSLDEIKRFKMFSCWFKAERERERERGPLGALHCHILLFVMVCALPLSDTHAKHADIQWQHCPCASGSSTQTPSLPPDTGVKRVKGKRVLEVMHLTTSAGTKKKTLYGKWKVGNLLHK